VEKGIINMADIRISKIKARRGTNDQRKQVVFDQGELIFTTDTQRFYIGDGVTIGAKAMGMKMHNPLLNYNQLSSLASEMGDVVKAGNSYYQLTGSNFSNINSWAPIRLAIDSIPFNYDNLNQLSLNTNSISAIYINNSTVLSGVKIENGIIQSNFNTKGLQISANQLTLKPNGIDELEINSTSFGNGISGGSGSKIELNVDTNKFTFDSGVLKLPKLPITYGNGLVYDTTTSLLSSTLTSVTGALSVSDSGVIEILSNGSSGTNLMSKVTVDQYGRVVGNTSSIYGTLSGSSSSGSYNITNSLSSIFNGSPTQSLSGAIPGMQLTYFSGISSNGVTSVVITLSSAGFLTFEGNTTTQNGTTIGRFAIPIFAF
jgi:hypothetical protein